MSGYTQILVNSFTLGNDGCTKENIFILVGIVSSEGKQIEGSIVGKRRALNNTLPTNVKFSGNSVTHNKGLPALSVSKSRELSFPCGKGYFRIFSLSISLAVGAAFNNQRHTAGTISVRIAVISRRKFELTHGLVFFKPIKIELVEIPVGLFHRSIGGDAFLGIGGECEYAKRHSRHQHHKTKNKRNCPFHAHNNFSFFNFKCIFL